MSDIIKNYWLAVSGLLFAAKKWKINIINNYLYIYAFDRPKA